MNIHNERFPRPWTLETEMGGVAIFAANGRIIASGVERGMAKRFLLIDEMHSALTAASSLLGGATKTRKRINDLLRRLEGIDNA